MTTGKPGVTLSLVALATLFVAACSCSGEVGGDDDDDDLDASVPPVTFATCDEAFADDEGCAIIGRTFYVSSSQGSDGNSGLSEGAALATIAAVNQLALEPGDRVLFRCGDIWRDEMLTIVRSGVDCGHIVFGSYPERTCEDQPIISGGRPITGWSRDSGDVWVADLDAGDNAGYFAAGINQLFRGDARLPMGKWPNPDDAGFMRGYSTIDRQIDGVTIEDDDLPPADYSGAVIRLKTIRWLLLSRRVASSSGVGLVLEDQVSCWGGTCGDPDPGDPAAHGWGYLITNHRSTLDQEGEWYYDQADNRVFLYSATEPTEIEGSVVPDWVAEDSDWRYTGGVVLGNNLAEHIQYVVVENLRVERWFSSGITTPINLELDDNSNIVIRCNTVRQVESVGINLATWVWNAGDASGWRGGHDLVVTNNVVADANHFGINSFAYSTTFQDNLVRDVGLAENLGAAGLGCGYEGSNCTENGDGIRLLMDQAAYTSHAVAVRGNRVERTGYCGVDVFGGNIELVNNVIVEACYSKGDCGAVRTFGRDSFAASQVDDIRLRSNIIRDVIGNTDGDNSEFKTLFGFGLYIDHFSKNVVATGNTIVRTTASGILYQDSRGTITGNTVYDNDRGQVTLVGDSSVDGMTGNVLYALEGDRSTMTVDAELSGSDDNYFFAPYDGEHISAGGDLSLAEWHSQSGMDGGSVEAWFTLSAGAPARSMVLVNEGAATATFELDGNYLDVDQAAYSGSVELEPYSSLVLIAD